MCLKSVVQLAFLLLLQLQGGVANDSSKKYSSFATDLRSQLLEPYDKVVPPPSERLINYSKAGVDVGLQVRFFKVQQVDLAHGEMKLKVWVRMAWTDERLSWDPLAYGNITHTFFLAAGPTFPEDTEIWLPDLQLFNAHEGLSLTLEAANAQVDSNGSVFWSRPGVLHTMCKFSGLVAFPFDNLFCAMEWGGWTLSSEYQGIYLMGDTPGYDFSEVEETAGTSYQEYVISEVRVSKNAIFYAAHPAPWEIVKFEITLGRATFYYIIMIVFPSILITVLSFGVFWMDPQIGERLSFGITLVLVIEVMKGTVAVFVPICGELLWVDLFMMVNLVFCCLSLVETMLVLFLAFYTEESLLPAWMSIPEWPKKLLQSNFQYHGSTYQSCGAGKMYRSLMKNKTDASDFPKIPLSMTRVSNIAGQSISTSDFAKLIFFENLFFLLDKDADGILKIADVVRMMSFVILTMDDEHCAMEIARVAQARGRDYLNRDEFIQLCVEFLWTTTSEEIQIGVTNYQSGRNHRQKCAEDYWTKWSRAIDSRAQYWIPSIYLMVMVVVMNLDFTDSYRDGTSAMFEGPGPAQMSATGVVESLITPFVGALCTAAAYCRMQQVPKMKKPSEDMQKTEVNVASSQDSSPRSIEEIKAKGSERSEKHGALATSAGLGSVQDLTNDLPGSLP